MGALRIKNTILTSILCIILTFGAAIIILSEWHFKEDRLSPFVFKLLSTISIVAYVIVYSNLAINIFASQRSKRRGTTENIILIIYFIGQSFFTITIFLSLFFILLGFW